ncbi:DNRLRE domain-containing protein, partial [bacterium]|nr:DNRLRE domain-containing protein [bacterium]
MNNRIILLTLLLCLSLSSSSLATEYTIQQPIKDACVCDCQPNANNVLGPDFLGQGRYGVCYTRTFIQWDLSAIPAGATITSAEFRIYVADFHGSPNGEMAYYRVTEDWDETTVTYLGMPAYTTDGAVFTANWPS